MAVSDASAFTKGEHNMQSTVSDGVLATPVSVSPASLAAAFASVPDPRRHASITYPLAAVLTLAVSAMLSNHGSVLAMAEWGARQSREVLAQLGFATGQTPRQSTLQRLFAKLDGRALSATLAAHFAPAGSPTHATRELLHGVAIDGKAQRGRLPYAADGSPVHALSAFCHRQGLVLAHEPIEPTGDKAAAELTAAPALVARIDWAGRVLTGDALFCQRALCQQVLVAGGDYLLVVKENQPALHAAIRLLFDPPPDDHPLPLVDRRTASTLERGHGRTDETREVVASTDLVDYLDWPGHAQVIRVERRWHAHGAHRCCRHYGISSLTPTRATPAQLLALKRGHWSIENRLHRTKDVTFGEDASLIHVGHGPTVMALLRDAAVNVLHRAGVSRLTACLRDHSQHPERAVRLLIDSPPAHA
jgi:predicted transposase YbfD/YdcC